MIKLPDNFTTQEPLEYDENKLNGLVLKLTITKKIDFKIEGNNVSLINYEKRTVDILNRRYNVLSFFSEVEANDFISKNPKYSILSSDEIYFNVSLSDYDGVEINFIPYEFKRYEIEKIPQLKQEVKKHTKVTWISEENSIKRDVKRKQ